MFLLLLLLFQKILCVNTFVYIKIQVIMIKIITIIVINIIINHHYKIVYFVIIVSKSHSHQEKGVNNNKSELTIHTLIH